jgi:hypothetical protein
MEIKICKAAHRCAKCEHEFVHGEEVFSLIRTEEGALIREDYVKEEWDPAWAVGAVASWSTKFYDPKVVEQEPPEVFSPLRQLFYETAESENRDEVAVAYLAAQLLRRQKVFRRIKESDDTEGEAKLSLFSDRIGNRLIEVRDPNLSYEELEQAQHSLLERLRTLEADEEEADEVDVEQEEGDESHNAAEEE